MKSFELAVHRSPAVPALDRKLVHLWLLDLDSPMGFRCRLTADELERVRRLKSEVLRRRMQRRYALSRLVLAGILEVQPDAVAYVQGFCGKPKVVPAQSRLRPGGNVTFNLSHSENVLAMVVGFGVETGVDVEVLDHGSGTLEFYQDWTLQEAVSKLAGTGIALRGGAALPSTLAVRSLKESFGGREVVLAVAISDPAALPDPHQGVFAENPSTL